MPVKSIRLAGMNKLGIAQAHGSKVSYTLCRREGSNVAWIPKAEGGATMRTELLRFNGTVERDPAIDLRMKEH
ncbi:MAG TPA: hypothetical protein VG206_13550, partial [Terriglobia bacterium]|nr:hypothetical protein [Terriglobia bacterium]